MFEIANYYICWTPMEFRALTFSLFLTLTAAGLSLFPYFWYWQQLAHRLLLQKKRKRENFIPWARKTDRKTLCEQPHSSHRQLSYCVHVGLLTCNTPPLAWESDEELEYLGHPWTLRTKVVGIKYYDSSPTSDTKNLENWLSHFNTLSHISFSSSQSSMWIWPPLSQIYYRLEVVTRPCLGFQNFPTEVKNLSNRHQAISFAIKTD